MVIRRILFIHPPISKPCEPPAGIARLRGALSSRGIRAPVLDANLEGILTLLGQASNPEDTWTRRAARNLPFHLDSLRTWDGYENFSRYQRAVRDINRLLGKAGDAANWRISLGNCEHRTLSPLKPADLIRASEHPEENPFFPYFKKRVATMLEEEAPPAVGLSLNFLSQALGTFALIGFLKRLYPKIKVIVGGGLVTSWMRGSGWRNPFSGLVDSFIDGEGEGPLLSLLGWAGPETAACPAYDAFPIQDYFAPGPILPYSASSGCYWNRCTFCPEKAEGDRYRPIPPDRVVKELKILIGQKTPVLVHLLDNAISPALLSHLIKEPPGVPWYGFARITEDLADLDFCLGLKKSGCRLLQLGLESGDAGVLENLQKGIHLKTASLALRNLKHAGIGTYVYLLFGTPAEAEDSARRTLDFTARHAEEIGFLNLALFNLPVNSPEAETLRTRKFYEGDLSLYSSFRHPRGWDRKAVREFLDKEFKRHPAIEPILRRDPPVFTSNHAPFFQ